MTEAYIINDKLYRKYDSKYFVSADGDVYSMYCHHDLKHNIDLDGYHRVDIHGKHVKVHKLVYLTWIGNISDDMQINHCDDNKDNNHYTNLYCGTQEENMHDKERNGHTVGHIYYLTVRDKQNGNVITFCPARDFFDYCGHKSANGHIGRVFTRNWYKQRYETISYGQVTDIDMFLKLKGVTTMGDECNPVALS